MAPEWAFVKLDAVLSHLHHKIALIPAGRLERGWADYTAADCILEAVVFLLPALLIRSSTTI
jgi:hypothetical protein